MKTDQMRKAKAIYSELVIAKVSDIVTCFWQRLKGRQRESFIVTKGKASGVP